MAGVIGSESHGQPVGLGGLGESAGLVQEDGQVESVISQRPDLQCSLEMVDCRRGLPLPGLGDGQVEQGVAIVGDDRVGFGELALRLDITALLATDQAQVVMSLEVRGGEPDRLLAKLGGLVQTPLPQQGQGERRAEFRAPTSAPRQGRPEKDLRRRPLPALDPRHARQDHGQSQPSRDHKPAASRSGGDPAAQAGGQDQGQGDRRQVGVPIRSDHRAGLDKPQVKGEDRQVSQPGRRQAGGSDDGPGRPPG